MHMLYLMIMEAGFSFPLCSRLYAVKILHLEASKGSSMSVARASCFSESSPARTACRTRGRYEVGKYKGERENAIV